MKRTERSKISEVTRATAAVNRLASDVDRELARESLVMEFEDEDSLVTHLETMRTAATR